VDDEVFEIENQYDRLKYYKTVRPRTIWFLSIWTNN